MSFTVPPSPPARPNRCQLFAPGSRPELFPKAAASAADVINLDLEDSVAPGDKPAARASIVRAINDIDWGKKTVSVRINGLDSGFWYRDVLDLVEQTAGRLDLIMIPKCGNGRDLYAVDALVSSIEWAKGAGKRIGFEALIETAQGLVNVNEIAAASPRLQSMHLGAADFAASMGMQTTGIGGTQEGYYMLPPRADGAAREPVHADPWHTATVAIVAACRTHGLLPVDGPFGDFSDPDGFRAQAHRAATLGMVGKWAIHPGQVALCNEVFTPSEARVAEAREILAAMKEAEARGQGAATYRGRLIDIASVRQAQVIVGTAELIGG
jgi:malyl-CoA/(S)-citramalyl-CoA lyase